MVDYAYVHIWDTLVGVVHWTNRQIANFQFDTKFLNTKWDIAPIKMPIGNGDRIYPGLIPSKGAEDDTVSKKGEKIIEEINTLVKQWTDFADRAKVRKELLKTIQDNLHTL